MAKGMDFQTLVSKPPGVPVTKAWKSTFCGSFRLKVGWFSEFYRFFLTGVARRFGSRKSSSLSHWCAWSNGAPEVWETQYFGMVSFARDRPVVIGCAC